MLRKDIENKCCAVYYARIQQLLQVSLLRRREFIVKNHQVEPQVFPQIAEFLCGPVFACLYVSRCAQPSPHRGAEAPTLPGMRRKRRRRSQDTPCGEPFFWTERLNRARKGLCDAPRLPWMAPLDKVIRRFLCQRHCVEPRLPVSLLAAGPRIEEAS